MIRRLLIKDMVINRILEEVRALVKYATGGLTPDLTILLDVEVEVGLKRKKQNGVEWNRMDAYEVEFYRRVRAGYLEMVKQEPKRWVVVDASRSWDEVQEELKKGNEEKTKPIERCKTCLVQNMGIYP